MDLKDKLKIYDRRGTEKPPAPQGTLTAIGAEPVPHTSGTIWRFTTAYTASDIVSAPGIRCCPLSIESFCKFNTTGLAPDVERLLFLDLETTSLSIGAGNYPFLTGIGYFKNGDFIIEQFFMEDYAAEAAILEYLLPYFERSLAIVTFNGKSFDIPLLKSRYRINAVPRFPVEMPVIDLVYPCRRVFKRTLPSCSLKSMEENVLGTPRPDDIPGWLIPDVFFSYQKYGETDRLPAVIVHNRLDVFSMCQILVLMNSIYAAVDAREYRRMERNALLSIARHLCRKHAAAFIDVMEFIGEDMYRERFLFKNYCTALKRAGRLEDLLRFLKRDMSLYALEELAKHYEHREKEFSRAREYSQMAVTLLDDGYFSPRMEPLAPHHRAMYRERFFRRMTRLTRRINASG